MILHRIFELVFPTWSMEELAGSWRLDKERHNRNKLMSENTELYSIEVCATDLHTKGTNP